jgi:syntaxin 5
VTSQSDFSRRAARIGHGIHSTSAKLARLTQLARRTSVFDDPTQEINELTAIVKQDITALNSALSELQGQASRRGGSKDSGEHSVTVVDALKARLMGATREFKDVLTLRQDNIKAHHNRRQLFSAQPEGGAGGGAGGSAAARRFAGALQTSGAGGLPTHTRGGGGLGLGGQQGGQMALALAAPAQDTYLASRAEALAQVEHTIAELGGIFTQLATMVAEQGELAIRIDEHMDDTVANVESAQAHLLKYLARVTSNRWLVMKVFAVLLLFMIVFVVFVA